MILFFACNTKFKLRTTKEDVVGQERYERWNKRSHWGEWTWPCLVSDSQTTKLWNISVMDVNGIESCWFQGSFLCLSWMSGRQQLAEAGRHQPPHLKFDRWKRPMKVDGGIAAHRGTLRNEIRELLFSQHPWPIVSTCDAAMSSCVSAVLHHSHWFSNYSLVAMGKKIWF